MKLRGTEMGSQDLGSQGHPRNWRSNSTMDPGGDLGEQCGVQTMALLSLGADYRAVLI